MSKPMTEQEKTNELLKVMLAQNTLLLLIANSNATNENCYSNPISEASQVASDTIKRIEGKL